MTISHSVLNENFSTLMEEHKALIVQSGVHRKNIVQQVTLESPPVLVATLSNTEQQNDQSNIEIKNVNIPPTPITIATVNNTVTTQKVTFNVPIKLDEIEDTKNITKINCITRTKKSGNITSYSSIRFTN